MGGDGNVGRGTGGCRAGSDDAAGPVPCLQPDQEHSHPRHVLSHRHRGSLVRRPRQTSHLGIPQRSLAMDYKKPSDAELRQRLTPMQYQVTQKEATERPFQNEYWDNHAAGIYVDAVSVEPVLISLDKYDSGTGWPSFTKPLEPENIQTKTDRHLFMERTEVRSSHLGHLFDDGPAPTGQRFCMNSASLRFIPVDQLEAEGYGQYLRLFKEPPPR